MLFFFLSFLTRSSDFCIYVTNRTKCTITYVNEKYYISLDEWTKIPMKDTFITINVVEDIIYPKSLILYFYDDCYLTVRGEAPDNSLLRVHFGEIEIRNSFSLENIIVNSTLNHMETPSMKLYNVLFDESLLSNKLTRTEDNRVSIAVEYEDYSQEFYFIDPYVLSPLFLIKELNFSKGEIVYTGRKYKSSSSLESNYTTFKIGRELLKTNLTLSFCKETGMIFDQDVRINFLDSEDEYFYYPSVLISFPDNIFITVQGNTGDRIYGGIEANSLFVTADSSSFFPFFINLTQNLEIIKSSYNLTNENNSITFPNVVMSHNKIRNHIGNNFSVIFEDCMLFNKYPYKYAIYETVNDTNQSLSKNLNNNHQNINKNNNQIKNLYQNSHQSRNNNINYYDMEKIDALQNQTDGYPFLIIKNLISNLGIQCVQLQGDSYFFDDAELNNCNMKGNTLLFSANINITNQSTVYPDWLMHFENNREAPTSYLDCSPEDINYYLDRFIYDEKMQIPYKYDSYSTLLYERLHIQSSDEFDIQRIKIYVSKSENRRKIKDPYLYLLVVVLPVTMSIGALFFFVYIGVYCCLYKNQKMLEEQDELIRLQTSHV
ncbi:hypothetical protein TRFO_16317 [Tritrichomonas foetus]|uniref:Uncharacterized protein n=1 Tax=Tritrichomonas foetus TaxID=1144522 RepID=A0A1J4KQT6_9EUKA|nr:hypothetical protein TRFO_16317 [Tritrichomonas foetus]|eukprot:OHT13458.1 hypothetical protein TRFO_16317 [Tritrichomonas foetus]